MICTQSGKLQPRRLAISKDHCNILVTTNKIRSFKGLVKAATGREVTVKVIPLALVDRVQRGTNSRRFHHAEQQQQTAVGDSQQQEESNDTNVLLEEDKSVSLSIVYHNQSSSSSSTTLEMLDLVVPNSADYDILMAALEDLVALCQEEKQYYTTDVQLLRQYWSEIIKEAPSSRRKMSMSEWMQLTDKLHIALKKSRLMVLFREMCKAEHEKEDETLSFPEIALLLDQVRKEAVPVEANPIEQLWLEMVQSDPMPAVGLCEQENGDNSNDDEASLELGVLENSKEDTISAVAFLSFLRSHQKEFQTTLEEATELIQILNRQKTAEDWFSQTTQQGAMDESDRLSRSRFLSYLTCDANDLLRPDMGKICADDMTQPLSHYWIHTSHDTYLKALPDSFQGKSAYSKTKGHGTPDLQAYTAALLRGVRCLELDVWDGFSGEPVVARQEPARVNDGHSLPLPAVLRTIRYFLEYHPKSFPVILKIENHCSSDVQTKVAKDLYDILGAARLIATPESGKDLTASIDLPSPASARGKVIIMGKRPKPGASVVVNDDFDKDNDQWEPVPKSADTFKHKAEYDGEDRGTVTGFDENGAIRTTDSTAVPLSPQDMLNRATEDAYDAQRELEEAQKSEKLLHQQADEQESLAAQLTLQAGLTPAEVKRRAALAAGGTLSPDDEYDDEVQLHNEEKSTKDEGVEVHEVLSESIEGGRDRYAKAAQEALAAAQRFSECETNLRNAENAHERAVNNLAISHRTEEESKEKAKRAAAEARSQFEHAETAKDRVEKVRELLRNSNDRSSSAGTVVQTALTEAKISEKRASDAESRAARAQGVAEKDRFRADEETKIEENMEQDVSDCHEECVAAGEAAKAARLRVEKAAAMLERANEQIKLIENSSQYRQELLDKQSRDGMNHQKDRPFLAKHAAKIEERDRCRELIKEATQENSSAEKKRAVLQAQFEEKAHAWRIQAELASQARRTADRSAALAEELTEHAEEEREAAELRHVARQKAEAAVENRDSHRASAEAQFAEAERAAAEAANIAVRARTRADRLAREAEAAKDHSRAQELVETKSWEIREAKGAYDAALLIKERKDAIAAREKHSLETNAELYKTAENDVADETNRLTVERLHEQEAIVAFNTAIMLRKEANRAARRTEIKSTNAESKSVIAQRAREYKEFKDMSVEIPSTLAKLTLLHTTRFKHWELSAALSNAHVHSFSQDVLLEMIQNNPEDERVQLRMFTEKHLCRVFPSWDGILDRKSSNYDPVLAWSLGCQLVAMNMHAVDENVVVADGLFRKNGSCGYVLKPRYLTHNDAKPVGEQIWLFKVIAGSNLAPRGRRTINPYVTISLYGGSETEARSIYRTRTAEQNGLNPVWDASKTFMLTMENPQIAMVSFAVWNKVDERTSEFIGSSAVPACCLREGYRSVPLFGSDNARVGRQAFASLLVNAALPNIKSIY